MTLWGRRCCRLSAKRRPKWYVESTTMFSFLLLRAGDVRKWQIRGTTFWRTALTDSNWSFFKRRSRCRRLRLVLVSLKPARRWTPQVPRGQLFAIVKYPSRRNWRWLRLLHDRRYASSRRSRSGR